ncbi:RED-lik [Cordyceps fumosorosea ARSEF 2679]|uniref:RED-lik n=1 Tax=Cordyceps fumosorosea (strain ARSEF 2679) TaxID=1081104 RepID=A0A162N0D6_CORFA|nr:RED-lik [Cordyceps fumosorosea ARSEF 2679]OAA73499.1 RED-lik [Cordyceps fumosorosea ARSEF 2679]
MNNEQFRKLMLANSAKSSKGKDTSPTQAAGSRGGSSLGSRQKASIPMTPRAVGNSQVDFSKQMAQLNQQANPTKQFKAAVPRGVKMAAGYTDRSKQREDQDSKAADDRAERLKALEESLKDEEIDNETYERLRFEIAGGDLESTHLVKGLDFKLLERVRRGEDVYSGKKDDADATQEEDVDVDDAFDQLEGQEVQAIEKDKLEKKKGQLSTVALAPGKKRTRNQILADFKAARAAAKAQAEPALGDRFRKIGAKQKPGTRIERDSKGREVMIIVDADGHEKRKVRKAQPGDSATDTDNGLLMPDKDAKPLGMEVPEQYRQKAPVVEEEEDVDIFDDVGDDYDPLAGMGESDSDSDSDTQKAAKDKAEGSAAEGSMPPPPPPPRAPTNYFKGSKTSLLSEQENKAPSMSDPAMLAAIKRAAGLRPLDKHDDDSDGDDDDSAAQKAKADAARRKKMLQNEDRDAEDMDMGFGTSRYEDEEDFDDGGIKLSAWGDEGGDEEGGARGGKKRKRNRKRKGDVNSAADVLKVMEQRKK